MDSRSPVERMMDDIAAAESIRELDHLEPADTESPTKEIFSRFLLSNGYEDWR